MDCLLVPAIPSADDLEEKKIVNKILSIQYSVFSALQLRAPYLPNPSQIPELKGFFIEELKGYR